MAIIGKVGDVEVSRIFDSSFLGITAQAWFPAFDRIALEPHEHWLCPTHYDPENGRIPMPVSSWLLRVKGCNVLIDTCFGNNKKRLGFPEMHLLNTRYLERLDQAGMRPEDVDYVLCTHLHVDHVGWNTRLLDGRWVPTFPNAKYVVSRKEYEATIEMCADPKMLPMAKAFVEDSVAPIMDAGKMVLVDDFHELLDSIRLTPAPGHSPNHLSIELRSQGATAAFVGDLIHSPMQIPFWKWSCVIDWNQAMAAQSRKTLLEFCCAENALLIPGHFEAPYAGRIRSIGDTFKIEFGW